MFNSLSDRLTATFKNLRGKGRLTEADVDATVREIRRALLDADVAVPVVREFTGRVRERALGVACGAHALHDGTLEVHSSLLNVVLYDKPHLRREQN